SYEPTALVFGTDFDYFSENLERMHFFSRLLLLIACFFYLANCQAQVPQSLRLEEILLSNTVLTGADNHKSYLPLLKNRKIGILTNQTGTVKDITILRESSVEDDLTIQTFESKIVLKHVVDFLIENEVNAQKIFA